MMRFPESTRFKVLNLPLKRETNCQDKQSQQPQLFRSVKLKKGHFLKTDQKSGCLLHVVVWLQE